MGEKTATELIVNFGSIENMYKVLKKSGAEAFTAKGVKARLEADEELVLYRPAPLDRAEGGVVEHVLTPNGEDDTVDGPVGQRRQLPPEGLNPAGR